MTGRDFWNEKYQNSDHLYSNYPNEFLKNNVPKIKEGKALVPGDGDGRNGLWLAKQGYDVTAFDYSEVAVKKANAQALDQNLTYHSEILSANNFISKENTYSLIAIIFVHLPKTEMKEFLRKSIDSMKENCTLLIQVFSPEQIHFSSGGPKDINLLYTTSDFAWMKNEFTSFNIEQTYCDLNEGPLHSGRGSVINLIGKK